MRERIQAELSDFLKKDVLLPALLREYETGFNEMILLNKAYAIMLATENMIDKATAKIILEGLEKVRQELKPEDLDARYEEIYYNVEQALFKRIGIEVGGKLHTGRSRNDIYATMTRMQVRRSLWQILESVIALQEILVSIAWENLDTVITGYTHMRPAQPITLAHYYTAVSNALRRDFKRLKNAYRNTNVSPYGAAALAGTGFPVHRQLLVDLLGFEKILINSLDAVGARDYILEAEAAFTIMMANVSRVVHDLHMWATDEFGILELGGEIAISSSIMPQKKNPVSLELAEAKAAHSAGAFISTFSVLKNSSFSFCMDLAESLVFYWEAHSQVLQSLGSLLETLKYATINKEKALERAKNNFSTVTSLADYLAVNFDIPFSKAHDIVGNMVAKVIDEGSFIDGIKSSLLLETSKRILEKELYVSDSKIQKVLDPYENIQSKKTLGSPRKDSVESMLGEANRYIDQEKAWLKEEMERVEQAYTRIEDEENLIRQ
jgi:argininosuccinate lyase